MVSSCNFGKRSFSCWQLQTPTEGKNLKKWGGLTFLLNWSRGSLSKLQLLFFQPALIEKMRSFKLGVTSPLSKPNWLLLPVMLTEPGKRSSEKRTLWTKGKRESRQRLKNLLQLLKFLSSRRRSWSFLQEWGLDWANMAPTLGSQIWKYTETTCVPLSVRTRYLCLHFPSLGFRKTNIASAHRFSSFCLVWPGN